MGNSNGFVQGDITKTYFALRVSLGLLALALPIALWAGGHWLQGLSLLPSLSAYYHSDVRDVFAGVLFAIGLGLIAYKGFSRREDWALNLGGALACGIALFPMPPAEALRCILPNCADGQCAALSAPFDRTAQVLIDAQWHFPFAIGFFAVLGFVMIFCAHHTLHLVPLRERRWYLGLYPFLGVVFVGSMVGAYVLSSFFASDNSCQDHRVIWVEIAGVTSFALYWFVKTAECKLHDTDRRLPLRRQPMSVLTKAGRVSVLKKKPRAGKRPSPWKTYGALWHHDRAV